MLHNTTQFSAMRQQRMAKHRNAQQHKAMKIKETTRDSYAQDAEHRAA